MFLLQAFSGLMDALYPESLFLKFVVRFIGFLWNLLMHDNSGLKPIILLIIFILFLKLIKYITSWFTAIQDDLEVLFSFCRFLTRTTRTIYHFFLPYFSSCFLFIKTETEVFRNQASTQFEDYRSEMSIRLEALRSQVRNKSDIAKWLFKIRRSFKCLTGLSVSRDQNRLNEWTWRTKSYLKNCLNKIRILQLNKG